MSTSTKIIDVSVSIDEKLFEFATNQANQNKENFSDYIKKLLLQQMDTTDYLLSSETNKKRILKSIKSVNQGKITSFNNTQEMLNYVQNRTK
jgi:PHD/YefM family antitoxin component YafN of YafNO toxin-antitoxin module